MGAAEGLSAGRRALRDALRALEGRALRGRPRRQAIDRANVLLRKQELSPLRPTTVGDWFTLGAAATDFESLWALVQVLLDWSVPPVRSTTRSDQARVGQLAGREAYWKTLWNQAKDSTAAVPTPTGTSPVNLEHQYHAPARVPMSFPHQVGVVPSRAAYFQDRPAARLLEEAMADGGTTERCQVLGGMGGVGKTQLAADHARHAWQHDQLELLLWVTAATRQAVIDAYSQAGTDLLGADPADSERAARTFLAWLEPKPGAVRRRWLIVLDDVVDAADLHGLWPPASPYGRTLITTRRRDSAMTRHGHLVPVDLFTTAEATTYLTEVGRDEPVDQLAALAADLGRLPLALSQAAAYLADTALDCATYSALLADRARRLPDLLPEPGGLPDQQPATVAAAWSLSIEHADQLRPVGLARPMLQLAAALDPNGIPQRILTSTPALAYLAEHRTTSTPAPEHGADGVAPITAEQAYGALRALHRLRLIDHTPGTPHQAVRVHQLIQRAVRDPLTLQHTSQLARVAADALSAAWPRSESDTALAQALRANTESLTRHAQDALWQPGAHPVLFRAGISVGESGQATAAIAYFRDLADAAHRRIGADHRDTLESRAHLARWRGEAGDAAGAAAAFAEVLADRLRVLGSDHPDTLATRSNLARWRGEAGDAAGAVLANTELLADRLRVLGPDHPRTLSTRHNLARWRGEGGDAVGAAAALVEVLADRLRVLGPDHRDTLATRHNLARWRGEAGDAAGAAAAFAEVLADRLRVLGPDNPHTLTTHRELARWRSKSTEDVSAAHAD